MYVPRLISILAFASTLHATAQSTPANQPTSPIRNIGVVGMQDATVSGDLSITGSRAILIGSSTVIAKDHTAEIDLSRGGAVRVCATSGLHLTQGQSTTANQPQAPLMLSLDRGAIEVQTAALADDVVMTPDLRLAIRSAGPLDLRLRVTRNGDTCVENRGASAPILAITDQFGEASYQLRPNQHVLFEHGSLKEVVDNETSPCGCPAPLPGMSIADAALAPPGSLGSNPQATATTQHPFPAAVSEGLAPSPPVPQAPAGIAHAQVATTLAYTSDQPAASSITPPAAAPTTPPPSGLRHSIGHFFKRLFGKA